MRDRSLDEFESIFEQASIPVLDIDEVALDRVGVVLLGGSLDPSAGSLADYLKKRFASAVTVQLAHGVDAGAVGEHANACGFELAAEPFADTADLVRRVTDSPTELVLVTEPPDEERGAARIDLETLVEETTPPILIVREPIQDPSTVFRSVLHSLSGNFRQTQNFTHSFTLVADEGELLLFHVISEHEIDDVRATLRVSEEVAGRAGEQLLAKLTHQGERYLKGVVAASRTEPFAVRYRLTVGEVVSTVQKELQGGDYTLLVVGTHHHGRSRVSAADYRLMHEVHTVPVLAL